MALIHIGDAVSFSAPDGFSYEPDDRQEIIPLIGGNTVQDNGWVSSGDRISFSATFKISEYQKLSRYWMNRQRVNVVDAAGNTWESCRVKIKKLSYPYPFANYVVAEVELWRI